MRIDSDHSCNLIKLVTREITITAVCLKSSVEFLGPYHTPGSLYLSQVGK